MAQLHEEVIAELQGRILHGGRVALAAPRGYGKTTLTLIAIIWGIVYGHVRFVVMLAAEANLGRKNLRSLKEFVEDADGPLAADFPEACVPAIALEGSPQRAAKQTVAGRRTP